MVPDKIIMASDVQELPPQDFLWLKAGIMRKRRPDGTLDSRHLFIDPTFPPDLSSLSYVYSGDDKYERMVFRRPTAVCSRAVLYGDEGAEKMFLPLGRWGGRNWLRYALAIVALNPRFVKRSISGHKDFEQDFQHNYIGAFSFRIWRFGAWVDVVVDDHLPFLDGWLAHCPTVGIPPQFWAPLLEKAYAKCNKAYEAVEIGNPCNAIVDMTGAICEHYLPEACLTIDLFHILYKSCVNRSLLVCWRSTRSYLMSGFKSVQKTRRASSAHMRRLSALPHDRDGQNDVESVVLYIVTAATKFPLRDGRLLEMVRLKNPYEPELTWRGDFSTTCENSWNSVNPTFLEKFRPQDCLEENESWMTYLDFTRHIGDVVIVSSNEPYNSTMWNNFETNTSRNHDGWVTEAETCVEGLTERLNLLNLPTDLSQKRGSIEITVQENDRTVKLNTVDPFNRSVMGDELFIRRSKSAKETARPCSAPKSRQMPAWATQSRVSSARERCSTRTTSTATTSLGSSRQSSVRRSSTGSRRIPPSLSVNSNLSNASVLSNSSSYISEGGSTYSTSEIQIKINGHERADWLKTKSCNSVAVEEITDDGGTPRPRSRQPSIFEAKLDFFRTCGSWQEILRHFGHWTKSTCGGPPTNMTLHSCNPRIGFAITRADAVSKVVPASYHGKSHLLISLMQDYRQGALTSNSMLVNIGFALYKSKCLEKDEKRHLKKLSLVTDEKTVAESRELTVRLDLDPGFYLLVPYTSGQAQEGEFLLRILCEKEQTSGKTGWYVDWYRRGLIMALNWLQ